MTRRKEKSVAETRNPVCFDSLQFMVNQTVRIIAVEGSNIVPWYNDQAKNQMDQEVFCVEKDEVC